MEKGSELKELTVTVYTTDFRFLAMKLIVFY